MDAREFEEVARELVEPLRRFLARRTDPATADDVLADTLLVCWRRRDELPVDAALPWAYGVARLCLSNAQRSGRRQERLAAKVVALDPPREVAPEDPDPSGVREALAALPPKDAELLRLWAWEQLAPAEIAAVLGVTPNAVSIRLHRARGKLREELGRRSGRKDGRGTGHGETTRGDQP